MRQRAEGRGQRAEESDRRLTRAVAADRRLTRAVAADRQRPRAVAADRRRPRRLTSGRLARREGAAASFFRALPSALCALILLLAQDAAACSVCYGAPGDPLVKGANNGIMLLLGIVGFVQIGFIAMFWSFWRKAREQRRFRESLRVIEGGPRP